MSLERSGYEPGEVLGLGMSWERSGYELEWVWV